MSSADGAEVYNPARNVSLENQIDTLNTSEEMNPKSSEWIMVWKQIRHYFGEIGMIVPSSRALAKSMALPLKKKQGRKRILEVGPGTGPMTKQILKYLGDEDEFVICEINPVFLAKLKENLDEDPNYHKHKHNVTFFEGPVQDLKITDISCKFDVIVSTLPFLNFDPQTVEEILALYYEFLNGHGVLTFCEYLGIRKLTKTFALSTRRERMKRVDKVLRRWSDKLSRSGSVNTRTSYLNFPPARTIEFDYRSRAQRSA